MLFTNNFAGICFDLNVNSGQFIYTAPMCAARAFGFILRVRPRVKKIFRCRGADIIVPMCSSISVGWTVAVSAFVLSFQS